MRDDKSAVHAVIGKTELIMAQAINPTEKAFPFRPPLLRSRYAGTDWCPVGSHHSLTSLIVSQPRWMIVTCGPPSLVMESLIDPMQGKFPTLGETPTKGGYEADRES